jgi:MFS family permease
VLSSLLSVVRNRNTWPAALVNTGMSGAFFTFAGLWATPYLIQVHGMARSVATTHLSLWFGGFAIGCLFIGGLSDRLGRRKPVLIVVSHVYALIWLVLLSCITLPLSASYLLFALLGLSTAGFSLTWACSKEVNPPLLSGMSTSVANMGGFLAGALLQPLVGWVMDLGWKGEMVSGARIYDVEAWRYGVLVVTICAVLGAASCWWIKETRCRNIWQAS